MRAPGPRAGDELPELLKHPTAERLAAYAAASGDHYQIHLDQEFARASGLPGAVVHGLLKAAYLAELAAAWAGAGGRLRTLEVSYWGVDLADRPLRCRGRVASVGAGGAELKLWCEDPSGTRTTVARAAVELERPSPDPSREGRGAAG